MSTKLENGKLFVAGEGIEVYEVKLGKINEEMFLEVELVPTEYTLENGCEGDIYLVDVLNETVVDRLISEGYVVIKEEDISHIENSDW